MFNASDEKQLLGKFCRAVEVTGGIEYSERSTPYIIADPNWMDLAYLYVEVARKLDITIRGCWGAVQHYWLPDGTLLKPALLSGVRQLLIDERPRTEGAEAQLRHVLRVFGCDVNDFEVQQIMEWCIAAGPPGPLLREQSDTLVWAPPDLVDLNDLKVKSFMPGEIKNLLRIPWYVPETPVPEHEALVLASANEIWACVGSDVECSSASLKVLGIQSVMCAEESKQMYENERFFIAP